MKLPIVAAFVVLASLTAAGCGGDRQVVKPDAETVLPIRPYSNCLDANHLSKWFVASPTTLYAADGIDHFRINMSGTCPRMGETGSIRFESANHTGSDTRICGDSSDRLFTDAGVGCAIGSVVAVSSADFDNAQQEAADKH